MRKKEKFPRKSKRKQGSYKSRLQARLYYMRKKNRARRSSE